MSVKTGSTAAVGRARERVAGARDRMKAETQQTMFELSRAESPEDAIKAGWRVGQANQLATALMIVTVAVAVVIGVFVVAEVNDAIPSISNSNLSTGRTDVIGGFGDALGLMAVFFVVAVASLILGVVTNLA